MSSKNITGVALLVVGVVIVIVSLGADYIGVGGFPGFGFKQVIGTIVGAVLIGVGLVLLPKRVKVLQ